MEYEILLLNIVRDIAVSSGFMDCIGPHSIASYIEKKGFKGKVYSGGVNNAKKVIKNEIEKNNVKIIGFYMAADNKSVVANIIKWLKVNFNIITVVGGPEAIGLNSEFFIDTECDYVIIGEGEEPISQLLSYIIDGVGVKENIESLVYKDKNGILKRNNIAKPIYNLDNIPFPKIKNSLNKSFRKSEMVGIITGRGCPFHCSFCYEGANAKSVRFRSIKNVMEEIDYISQNNAQLKYINVYDDTFTLDFKRVFEFCDEIKKRGIKWFCEGHITNIVNNKEMINYMVESGLVSMQLGIESGSQKVLDAYNKKTTPEMILEAVKICKEAGILCVSGNFIIGGACETEESVEDSLILAKKLLEVGRGVFDCRSVFLAPYTNTKIFLNPKEFSLKINNEAFDSSLTSMRSAVIETEALSVKRIEELKNQFDEALKQEYLKQVMKSDKNDVVSAFFFKGEYLKINSLWQSCYRQIEYINNFITFYKKDDDTIDYDKYIIRTMENFYGIVLSEDEYEFLKMSNGKFIARNMMNKLKWNENKFEKVYHTLRNKCMVYLSDF